MRTVVLNSPSLASSLTYYVSRIILTIVAIKSFNDTQTEAFWNGPAECYVSRVSRKSRFVSCKCWTPQRGLTTWQPLRGTDSKNWQEIVSANTAFGSMTNGACALDGLNRTPTTSKSTITTLRGETMARNKRQIPLAHPGEILNEEFLKPLGITINALALALRVPSNRIYAIVEGERGVSADTALRLGRYFGTTPEFWINLQTRFELENAKDQLEDQIEREVQPRS
jgi:antitoxin HigA-1